MKDKIEFDKRNQYELELYQKGHKIIVGLDEVGRGPLAGPVCVGAVILDPANRIYGLKDSKKLSYKKICELNDEIMEKAIECHTAFVSASVIDRIGIKAAVHLAFKRVLDMFKINIDYILIDFEKIEYKDINTMSIIKGDDLSNSIAAASIIAKCRRDKYMHKIALKYPEYGFDSHVGYGTKKHKLAIEEFGGIEKVHRFSFKPLRKDWNELY